MILFIFSISYSTMPSMQWPHFTKFAYSQHSTSPTQEISIHVYTYVFINICKYVYFLLQCVYVTVWNKIKVIVAYDWHIWKNFAFLSEMSFYQILGEENYIYPYKFSIPAKMLRLHVHDMWNIFLNHGIARFTF